MQKLDSFNLVAEPDRENPRTILGPERGADEPVASSSGSQESVPLEPGNPQMMKVAVTGNVASGKTLLCRTWAREDVPLVSADELAREAVEPGSPGLEAVVKVFGTRVLDKEGRLDRAALRKMVFHDSAVRKRLEGILHPIIRRLREGWMEERKAEGCLLAVAEIPLLFEAGLEEEFDLVVLVDAPPRERLRRLMEDRKLEEDDARSIMEAQMPVEEKMDRTDYVIRNDGSRTDLEIRALALLDLLRARARNAGMEGRA